MKVAVASQNQRVIHQHFGRATQFLIYEIEELGARLVEIRQNRPPCGTQQEEGESGHDANSLQRSVDLLADCRAVVVAQIGQGAVAMLSQRGIQAFVIPGFIDTVLQRLKNSGRLNEPVVPGEGQFKWLNS